MPQHHSPSAAVHKLNSADVSARADELVTLQRAAYRVEAELIGDERIPQLSGTPAQLVTASLEWHVILEDGAIIAAVATGRTADGLLDIERLVVDPAHHRRGPESTLIESVVEQAAVVMTGQANVPARRLYERLGFQHVEDHEVLPGL